MAERYSTLHMPVAVLFGQDDRILNWGEHGVALEGKVLDLDLTLVPGGHMLPVTAPDRTVEWLMARRTGRAPRPSS